MSLLRDIRDYLKQRKHASLSDLTVHFATQPDAMRGMLEQWIVRGKVRRCSAVACEGCSSRCDAAPGESYEWVE